MKFRSLLILLAFVLAGCAPRPVPIAVPEKTTPTPAAAAQLEAQLPDRPPRFERLSVAEGLSQSVVTSILQDRQGFLWFGTTDGLNRYDGYTFQIYRNDPSNPTSISHSRINALLEDDDGYLWIGLYNAGINRFDPLSGEFKSYRINGSDQGSQAANRIRVLERDQDGTLWAGTHGGGLLRYNAQKDEFDRFPFTGSESAESERDAITSLVFDDQDRIWVGTGSGLYNFDRQTSAFTLYPAGSQDEKDPLRGTISSLYHDGDGWIWIGVKNGSLLRLNPENGAIRQFIPGAGLHPGLKEHAIRSILIDRSGVLWLASEGAGLCRGPRMNAWTGTSELPMACFTHDLARTDSLGVNELYSLYEDRSGVLWIGTYGSGVNRLLPAYKPFFTLQNHPEEPDSLASNMIFALCFDGPDVLWAGTYDQGLERIDLKSGQISHYRSVEDDPATLSTNAVFSIFRDSRGILWVGTGNGLNRMDETNGTFKRYLPDKEKPGAIPGKRVIAIAETPDGMLWLAQMGDGLTRFDPLAETFTLYKHDPEQPNSLSDTDLFDIEADSDGVLWLGTSEHGLERFDPAHGIFTHYEHNSAVSGSISDPTVLWVKRDSSGALWAATASGLNRLKPTDGSFRAFRMADGLPNDFIYTFLEDEQGRLWITTNKGIARLDPRSDEIKTFDVHDGLQSDEFNSGAAARAPDGRMAFAGINGITLFYPDQVRDNPYVPPVALTTITRHGNAVPVLPGEPQKIVLRWPDNYFDVEFAALDYVRSEKNQYAYMLENFDREWNITGTRRDGRYTNLPGGTYTLRVRGANSDGVWNENGAALIVQVIPPFWQTWWFQSGLVVLLIAVVGLVVRFRLRGMETRTRELERLVHARTSEIERLFEQNKELAVVEERNRLARDLHDSAKQRAFAALAQIGAVGGLLKSDPRKAQGALAEAETLVYEVIEELTFLIQEMYPVALREKGLAAMLREYLYEWEARSDIRVDFHTGDVRRAPLNVEQAFYRVAQEALANVARHSQAKRVKVALVCYPTQITLQIEDDGRGFDPNARPAGIGMRSMRERINMVGGTLKIDSQVGSGTTLFAWAPIPPMNGKESVTSPAAVGQPIDVEQSARDEIAPPDETPRTADELNRIR
jgi:signal transduction histidine kinase/ligand-binding sensor domain-containing protein